MTKKLWVVALAAASMGLSGCALLLVGAGAAGGYAVGKDSVKNNYDMSMEHVYRVSLDVAKQMGHVMEEDASHGIIRATVSDANVTITVKQLTRKTVELKVKARKIMPKMDVAQEIYYKIAQRL